MSYVLLFTQIDLISCFAKKISFIYFIRYTASTLAINIITFSVPLHIYVNYQ